MTSMSRGKGSTGALFDLSGVVANNATWSEDIYFSEDGSAMDISGLDFKLTLRCDPESTTADLTLSTDDGTLSVETDDASVDSILRITVPASSISGYVGDYQADLASQDSLSTVQLWASGTITFRQNPVSF